MVCRAFSMSGGLYVRNRRCIINSMYPTMKSLKYLVLLSLLWTFGRSQELNLSTAGIIAWGDDVEVSVLTAPLVATIPDLEIDSLTGGLYGENLSGSSGATATLWGIDFGYEVEWSYSTTTVNGDEVLTLEVTDTLGFFTSTDRSVIGFDDLGLSASEILDLPDDIFDVLDNGTPQSYWDDGMSDALWDAAFYQIFGDYPDDYYEFYSSFSDLDLYYYDINGDGGYGDPETWQ